MIDFIRLLIAAAILGAIGYGAFLHFNSDDAQVAENAPSGTIFYFESEDGESFVALYEDRIEAKSEFSNTFTPASADGSDNSVVRIPVSDIESVDRQFSEIRVLAKDGSYIKFSLDALGGRRRAQEFEEAIRDLIGEDDSPGE